MIRSRLAFAAASTLMLAGCQFFSGGDAVAPKAPSAAGSPAPDAGPAADPVEPPFGPGPEQTDGETEDAVISGAATATVDGLGRLTINGANGAGFAAKRAVPADGAAEADPALLQGADWVVEDLNRGGVIDNTRLTLTFGADGKVSGSTNCNRFNGTFTATATSVSFGPLAMTRRACTGEALSLQQRKYMDALGGVITWTIEADGALVLTGDAGERVLLRR